MGVKISGPPSRHGIEIYSSIDTILHFLELEEKGGGGVKLNPLPFVRSLGICIFLVKFSCRLGIIFTLTFNNRE